MVQAIRLAVSLLVESATPLTATTPLRGEWRINAKRGRSRSWAQKRLGRAKSAIFNQWPDIDSAITTMRVDVLVAAPLTAIPVLVVVAIPHTARTPLHGQRNVDTSRGCRGGFGGCRCGCRGCSC